MRAFLLLPLVAALPARPHLPDLSLAQWAQVQAGFTDRLHTLTGWSLGKAQDVVDELQAQAQAQIATDGDETELTVWQQLKADPHSFSRLTGIIEFIGGKLADNLDNPDFQFTLFAPNNDALKPPPHRHHKHKHHKGGDDDGGDDDHNEIKSLMKTPSLATVAAILDRQPAYLLKSLKEDKDKDGDDDGGDDDDDKKKRRLKIIKKIALKIIEYHGLPKAYTASEIAQNVTLETALEAEDGSFGGLHRRVRVEKTLVPPGIKLNFYAKLLVTDKKAKNGIIHTLDHPLIPPPSVFEALYLFPDFFSTLTSAIQGNHARKYLDWGYDRKESSPGKPKFHGAPLVTLFAPTNTAFHLLPPKLKFFLFSPFGKFALAKLLMYHGVKDSLVLSEFQYTLPEKKKSTFEEFSDALEAAQGKVAYPHWNTASDPSFHQELEVPTALPNATLKLVIDKTKLLPIEGAVKTTIKVNDQLVETIDVPARNGAIHVINKLLVPPHHHHGKHGEDLSGDDSFENWEEWLPAWAAEEF